jgi:hypothetical protein
MLSEDDAEALLELLALLLLLAALLELLLPLAEGDDLLDEQPVAPVRTIDVRRDFTEDHAPGEYSRHLRT